MIFSGDKGIEKINVFQIYSRWGEKVYEAYDFQPNDPNYGWDGFHRGKLMNPNVFGYWVEVEFINGKTKIFKGDVTLLR
jgi:hypothetical protein